MLRNTLTLLLLALVATMVSATSSYKYNHNFATKTAYWDQTKALSSSDKAATKRFTLRQVQAVARHGARFPTSSNTQEIMDLLANLQTNYSSVIPAWMRNYSLPYNLTVQGNLAPAGKTNLKDYGTRMRSRIGSQLPTSFNASSYIMQHTYKSRCKDSAIAYVIDYYKPSDQSSDTADGLTGSRPCPCRFASTFFSNPDSVTYTAYTSTYVRSPYVSCVSSAYWLTTRIDLPRDRIRYFVSTTCARATTPKWQTTPLPSSRSRCTPRRNAWSRPCPRCARSSICRPTRR